jgi:hypothetical protein
MAGGRREMGARRRKDKLESRETREGCGRSRALVIDAGNKWRGAGKQKVLGSEKCST